MINKKGKILITGGSGFIGSHLTEAFLKQGRTVICLDKKINKNYFKNYKKIEFLSKDITDQSLLKLDFSQVNEIYHLAGVQSYLGLSKEEYDLINVKGTRNLLELSVANKIKRFVFFSSISAVGSTKEPVVLDEDSLCRPYSVYGESKRKAEELIFEYFSKHKLPTIILRTSKVYGPRDKSELIKLYAMIKKRIFCSLQGMQNKKISFCYIENLIEACMCLDKNNSSSGNVYFISDRRPYTWKEFIHTIAKSEAVPAPNISLPVQIAKLGAYFLERFNKKLRKSALPPTQALSKIVKDYEICSISKAKQDLNFYPKFNLEEGMYRTIKWYNNSINRKK
ncbi:NAD(P)-dependent oxidoreductase [Candidatus Babeliales bacterium]|nr:NAD(P)-dependent oxidoreductase [Candidatus Babeliales bacterium]